MTDISELQARLTAALDRIGSGMEVLEKPIEVPDTSAEVDALNAQLEEERTVNAQLEERVRAIKDRQDSEVADLSADVARLTQALARQEEQVGRLASVNAELRANNAALREAISEGVAEPHLVNKAMMAELEGLRAAQAADRAEIDAVLGELDGMITKAARPTTMEESDNA